MFDKITKLENKANVDLEKIESFIEELQEGEDKASNLLTKSNEQINRLKDVIKKAEKIKNFYAKILKAIQ